MRIRKRAVPLPLSSLCPVPLSSADRHLLSRSPVVQLQLHEHDPPQDSQKGASFDRQPPPSQPIGGENGADRSVVLEDDERGIEGDASASDPTSAEMDLSLSRPESNSSNNQELELMIEKDKKMKRKMMNKKCVQQDGLEEVQDDDEKKEARDGVPGSVRKRGRGGALMEGSRCSRVNGRGWRCCQQTLVGYSLCEHHLGKGRLKSMTNVQSQRTSASTKTKKAGSLQPLSSHSSFSLEEKKDRLGGKANIGKEEEEEEEEGGDDDMINKPLVIAKRKMKIGMLKARSMSSLLGSANDAIRVHENNK